MEILSSEAARLSQGSVTIEIAAGSPRSVKQLIDDVHVGRVFATWASTGMFSRMVPEISAISLPFAYHDYDEARQAVSGPVGTLFASKLDAKGFVVLAFLDQGAMQVANASHPLRTLADFKDLKLRVLAIATHAAAFRAIGARPVTIELSEVAAALRQGDVEGLELTYSEIYANRYYDTQRYLSDTGHFREFHVLVASTEMFAGLDSAQQKAIRDAAAIAARRQHVMAAEDERTALARLKDQGVQFDPLPPDTRLALRQAMAGVVDGVRKSIGAGIVDDVLPANRGPAAAKAAGRPADPAPRR
jgi:TRAP-type C4-dicarboxylate transport system substrate-binding protein